VAVVNGREQAVPIHNFINALASQLDLVQETMRLKAERTPLTFAVKDLSLDLRAHVEVRDNVVRIRPAGPDDAQASTVHLELTGITKPTIEENTPDIAAERDAPSIKEVLGDAITEEEQRQLEWAGIRNVEQLRRLHEENGEHAIERVAQLPVDRLRAALARASQPLVRRVDRAGGDGLLRIRGFNLAEDGHEPEVRIDGEPASVVASSERELVVRPAAPRAAGTVEVRSAAGAFATGFELGDEGSSR
jgi:hypothetical protein